MLKYFYTILAPLIILYFGWCVYDMSLPVDEEHLISVSIIDRQTGLVVEEIDLPTSPDKIRVKHNQAITLVRSLKPLKSYSAETTRVFYDSKGIEYFDSARDRRWNPRPETRVMVSFNIEPIMATGLTKLAISTDITLPYNLISSISPVHKDRQPLMFTIID